MFWFCRGERVELSREAVERELRSAERDVERYATGKPSRGQRELGMSLAEFRALGKHREREAKRLRRVLVMFDAELEHLPEELYPPSHKPSLVEEMSS